MVSRAKVIENQIMPPRKAPRTRTTPATTTNTTSVTNCPLQAMIGPGVNVAQAYTTRTDERKEYAGTLPLCNKCKFHHNGPCTIKCANYKRVGHLTRYCWSSVATNNQGTLTCYECRNQGHYKSDCPELKNGNQARGAGTRRMVLTLVGREPNKDLDDMEDNTNA
ncbi:reverse transcriptase domain-containing protein [Tanacetum coccineum]